MLCCLENLELLSPCTFLRFSSLPCFNSIPRLVLKATGLGNAQMAERDNPQG